MERVQRRFCRYVFHRGLLTSNPNFHYSPICRELRISTLEERRKFFDLIFVVKSLNGMMDSSSYSERFVKNQSTRELRSSHFFNYNPNSYSTINRAMKLFNETCPPSLIHESFNTAKRQIASICFNFD